MASNRLRHTLSSHASHKFSSRFTQKDASDTDTSTITVGFDCAGSEKMTLSGAVEGFSSTGSVSGNSVKISANWSS
jgi:hypothetical protein